MSLELLRKVAFSALLDELLTALFSAPIAAQGDLILKTYDLARTMRDASAPVVSFQTPMGGNACAYHCAVSNP